MPPTAATSPQHGEPPVIDGLTGDQRFFIAYGYSWETKQREGALRASC
jgi:putative endopeptidase